MKNFFKLFALLILVTLNMYSQQTMECGLLNVPPNQDFDSKTAAAPNDVCINVYFHIVREWNGTGGLDPISIHDVIENFNEKFNTVNINTRSSGFSFIDNSNYYNLNYDTNINEVIGFDVLIQQYNVSNAINYFLVNKINVDGSPTTFLTGAAEGVLSKNFITGVSSATSITSAHELGHCLNLYHTHHGTYFESGNDPNQCPENINGSNCSSCGDYVCDTPADPRLIYPGLPPFQNPNFDPFTCTYIANDGYNPDVKNIMSYGLNCREYFSAGQGVRMRNAINGSPILQPIRSTICSNAGPTIDGDWVTCVNNATVLTVENAIPPYNWIASSNITITTTTNGSSIEIVPINTTLKEYGHVTVSQAEA